MAKNACGNHTELASNDAVRVTRCPCGTVHVTLVASGVTVRMPTDVLRATSIALRAAVERIEGVPQAEPPLPTTIN